MNTVKVNEASGKTLDWLVAECEGFEYVTEEGSLVEPRLIKRHLYVVYPEDEILLSKFNPSTDWSQGGPIMVREDIIYRKYHRPDSPSHGTFYAMVHRDSGSMVSWHRDRSSLGPTPLVAAMRCYVASKLGETAEVPKELA